MISKFQQSQRRQNLGRVNQRQRNFDKPSKYSQKENIESTFKSEL